MDIKNLKKIIREIKSLSFLAMGRTSPNPPVAAVISDANGNILASGNTQITGLNHAEKEAYQNLDSSLLARKESTTFENSPHQLFVSLEPCTHFGKTPPCRDLILKRKPSHLTMGWRDPNPLVNSGDWEEYKTSHIITKLHPVLAQASLPFLHGFLQRIKNNRPWIWIKSAISVDGFYASLENNQTQISSEESGYYLQLLRAKFDAIVVGPNTIQVDCPSLNFRLNNEEFEEKGIAAKVDFGNISEFFSPGEQLLDSLFFETNQETFQEHVAKLDSYQPWRVFVLADGVALPLEFLKKQEELNERYGKKLCLFYILLSKTKRQGFTPEYLENLSRLTDFSLVRISDHDSDAFFLDLGNHGINTVMLEAGSFLWEFVKDNLDANDCILTIQSQKELGNGKIFSGFNQFEKQTHYQVGRDLWQLEMKS